MVKQGLLIKKQSSSDKRMYYLSLNEEIADIYLQYDKAMASAIQNTNAKHTEEEQEIFCKVLHSIEQSYIKEISHEK